MFAVISINHSNGGLPSGKVLATLIRPSSHFTSLSRVNTGSPGSSIAKSLARTSRLAAAASKNASAADTICS